jgi:hypothetical protein
MGGRRLIDDCGYEGGVGGGEEVREEKESG